MTPDKIRELMYMASQNSDYIYYDKLRLQLISAEYEIAVVRKQMEDGDV